MLEKCLKFISRQAYIQTAIHGSSFFTGCKDGFFLVARNIFSVGAVAVVSGLSLFIGKIFIMTLAGVCAFFFFQGYMGNEMYDCIACTVLVMIFAYMTALMFMDVFHIAIDTILVCYVTDSEQNNGAPQYADEGLTGFLSENGTLTANHKRVAEEGGEPGSVQFQKQNNKNDV